MGIDYWTACYDILLIERGEWRISMTIDAVTDITSSALFLIIQVAMPLLLISMSVGLLVSIFQTMTSIQEQTLTFVPKILSVFLTLIILGSWMLTKMVDFMTQLWSSFSLYIHR